MNNLSNSEKVMVYVYPVWTMNEPGSLHFGLMLARVEKY